MTLLKEKITFGTIMGVVREYFVMTIGILLYTFAWIACILPAHGTGGGATGAALVLCGAIENLFNFQINIGTMAFIVNGILLLFAGFIIGWNFGIKTIFCIIVLPASLNFFQETLPGVQAWLAELGVIPPMRSACSVIWNRCCWSSWAVCCPVWVSYMCFRQGVSTGGYGYRGAADQQYHPINYGRVVLVTDSLIICASLLVGNGIETVIYGFLLTAVFGLSTDALLAGNQQSNQILVISHEHDRIAAEIVEKAHRGVTMLNGMGWYTKESSQVVMVICRKRETADILKIVRNLDPKAFVSVASVTGVYGQGFGIIDGGMLNGMKKNLGNLLRFEIILLVDPAGSICFPGIMRNFTRRKTELIPSFCGCGSAPDGPVGSAA